MPGVGTQQDEDFVQRVFSLDLRGADGGGGGADMTGVGNELGRHLRRCQLAVHQVGGKGTARHAVELAGGAGLSHDHAAFGLDRTQSLRAITAGAGEDDADGPLVLVHRQ